MTWDAAVTVLVEGAFPARSCNVGAATNWNEPEWGVVESAVQVPAQAPVTVNVTVRPSLLSASVPAKVTVRVLNDEFR
jgi:hypothetical protein